MDKLLRELLTADKIGHRLVKPLLERYCEIHSDTEQRINSLVEIISDIRQPISEQSTQTPRSREKLRHLQVKVGECKLLVCKGIKFLCLELIVIIVVY